MEFYSVDFQCPDTGWGVYFIFDESKEEIRAAVCDSGIWDLNECDPEIMKDTQDWCRRFGAKYCASFDEAREIADRYDTFFS